MWLRRHDAVTESRSVDRFSAAMRVLSRRPSRRVAQYVVVPPPPGTSDQAFSGWRRALRGRRLAPVFRGRWGLQGLGSAEGFGRLAPVGGRPTGVPTPRKARAELRRRRLRVLLVLLATTAGTLLFAALRLTGWSLQLLVDLVLVAYVLHLRLQVVRAAQPASSPSGLAAEESAASPYAEELADVREPATAYAPGAAETAENAPAEHGWAPVPVPLPTYVTAPVAPARAGRERLSPSGAALPFEPDDAEIEVLFQHRWAVND